MRHCVYCERNDATSRDVSFHSFPKDDDAVIVWLQNMGVNIKWRPLKSHYLCSKHFSNDCLIGNRLRKGSVPTIFDKKETVTEREVEINCHQVEIKKVYLRNYNVHKKFTKRRKVEEPKIIEDNNIKKEINESDQILEVKQEVDTDDEYQLNVECIKNEEGDEILVIKKEKIDVNEGVEINIKRETESDDEPNDDGVKGIMQRNHINTMESPDNQLVTSDQPLEYEEILKKREISIEDTETSINDNENNALVDTETLRKIIICVICYKLFHSQKTYEEHVNEKHIESVSFSCSECNFTTNVKYSFESHIISEHISSSLFNCMYCGFQAYTKNYLDRHIAWRHIKRTFNCEHCNLVTRDKGQLKSHINSKHTKTITFSCSDCDYTTYTQANLNNHIIVKHTQTNSFNCTYCSFTTFLKRHLSHHINNKHTKRVPFNCQYCNYNTYYTSTLKKHINSQHTKSLSC